MPAVVPIITGIVALNVAHQQARSAQKASDAQRLMQMKDLEAQTAMSDKAALVEKTAADRAEQIQLEQRNYDREASRLAREDYLQRQSPYINMGNQAFGRLSELLNIPTNGAGPMPGGASMSSQPSFAPPQGPAASQARPSMAPAQQVPSPEGASMSSVPGVPSTVTEAQPTIGAGSQQPAMRGVAMIAPTGERGMVPYDKVAQAIAAGARRAS